MVAKFDGGVLATGSRDRFLDGVWFLNPWVVDPSEKLTLLDLFCLDDDRLAS